MYHKMNATTQSKDKTNPRKPREWINAFKQEQRLKEVISIP